MLLREALSVLSKSSPTAVSTAGNIKNEYHARVKDYLYTESVIEKDFIDCLKTLKGRKLILLSGSSGDGKSEILNRNTKHFPEIDFHLDATHAFDPHATAIDTLNSKLTSYKSGNRSLVIGINIGMLANFEREGSDEHADIRGAIRSFLDGNKFSDDVIIYDFEAYPKFSYDGNRLVATQFSEMIRKVVADDSSNPFRDLFNDALNNPADKILVSNYLLLRNRSVQKQIISLLFNARVQFDQFVTARMLLDFIHEILCGDSILIDTLFNGGSNEILEALRHLDPAICRTQVIDQFLLERQLVMEDIDLANYLDQLKNFRLPYKLNAYQILRLSFLLTDQSYNSVYPKKLTNEFTNKVQLRFKEAWQHHTLHTDDNPQKTALKEVYNSVLIPGLIKFANRFAPNLRKKHLFLSSHGGYHLAAQMELKPDYKSIAKYQQKSSDIHEFRMSIMVNSKSISAPINVNLFELLIDIVSGHFPSRFRRSTVVVLEELVNHITEIVSQTDKLTLFDGNNHIEIELDEEDGEIMVSGY